MSRKFRIYFYIALFCSILGLIFPTHVSQAIGFDFGDMIHWVYGFYILIPRYPVGEPRFYFNLHVQGIFLFVSAIILLFVITIEMRNFKHGGQLHKHSVYLSALVLILAIVFYETSGLIAMRLSLSGFTFSAIFALIGNYYLNAYNIDEKVINYKRRRIVGGLLLILSIISLINIIILIIFFVIPYNIAFLLEMLPALILLSIVIYFGADMLRRK